MTNQSRESIAFQVPQYDQDHLDEYRAEFNFVDKDKNGFLDRDEFIDYLVKQGTDKKMAKVTCKIVDVNHDNKISFDEFAEYIHSSIAICENNDVEAYLRLVFKSCDKNHNNSLDKKEFKKFMKFMNIPVSFFNASKKFKQFDTDKSGSIEFDEIMNMYKFEMDKHSHRK